MSALYRLAALLLPLAIAAGVGIWLHYALGQVGGIR